MHQLNRVVQLLDNLSNCFTSFFQVVYLSCDYVTLSNLTDDFVSLSSVALTLLTRVALLNLCKQLVTLPVPKLLLLGHISHNKVEVFVLFLEVRVHLEQHLLLSLLLKQSSEQLIVLLTQSVVVSKVFTNHLGIFSDHLLHSAIFDFNPQFILCDSKLLNWLSFL